MRFSVFYLFWNSDTKFVLFSRAHNLRVLLWIEVMNGKCTEVTFLLVGYFHKLGPRRVPFHKLSRIAGSFSKVKGLLCQSQMFFQKWGQPSPQFFTKQADPKCFFKIEPNPKFFQEFNVVFKPILLSLLLKRMLLKKRDLMLATYIVFLPNTFDLYFWS